MCFLLIRIVDNKKNTKIKLIIIFKLWPIIGSKIYSIKHINKSEIIIFLFEVKFEINSISLSLWRKKIVNSEDRYLDRTKVDAAPTNPKFGIKYIPKRNNKNINKYVPKEIKYPPESFFISKLTANDLEAFTKGKINSIRIKVVCSSKYLGNNNSSVIGPTINAHNVTINRDINNNLIEYLIFL